MTYQDITKRPFLADHVGSLLRPSRLQEARKKSFDGSIPIDELRKVEDECISEVIKKQEECELKAVTDGEFQRTLWHYDFLCGFEGVDQLDSTQGPNCRVKPQQQVVVMSIILVFLVKSVISRVS